MAVAVLAALLPGCDRVETPATIEIVQTVGWYREHETERAEMIDRCQQNPGELSAAPNCINADAAQSKETWSATNGNGVIVIDIPGS